MKNKETIVLPTASPNRLFDQLISRGLCSSLLHLVTFALGCHVLPMLLSEHIPKVKQHLQENRLWGVHWLCFYSLRNGL